MEKKRDFKVGDMIQIKKLEELIGLLSNGSKIEWMEKPMDRLHNRMCYISEIRGNGIIITEDSVHSISPEWCTLIKESDQIKSERKMDGNKKEEIKNENDLVSPYRIGDRLEVLKLRSWSSEICGEYPINDIRKGDVITITKIGKVNESGYSFAATFNGKEYGFCCGYNNKYRLVGNDEKVQLEPKHEPEAEKITSQSMDDAVTSILEEDSIQLFPKKRIYIAGKVTGLEYGYAKCLFDEAKSNIEKWGFEAVSPFDYEFDNCSWTTIILTLLPILNTCDGIYLLNNWDDSDGARIEKKFAEKKGMFMIKEVV